MIFRLAKRLVSFCASNNKIFFQFDACIDICPTGNKLVASVTKTNKDEPCTQQMFFPQLAIKRKKTTLKSKLSSFGTNLYKVILPGWLFFLCPA